MRPTSFDHAFHSYAKADSENSGSFSSLAAIPSLLDNLSSPKIEIRVSSLRSLNVVLTKSCAGPRIEPFLDVLVSILHDLILAKNSKAEHDESLNLLCVISLSTFSEFESRASIILTDLIPLKGDDDRTVFNSDESYRIFTIALLISFTFYDNVCLSIVKKYLKLLISNSKNIGTNLQHEILRGVCLMLSSLDCQVAANIFFKKICNLLENNFLKGTPNFNNRLTILNDLYELILIVYESLLEFQIREHISVEDDQDDQTFSFISKYREVIEGIPSQIQKKNDQKTVRTRTSEFLRNIDSFTNATCEMKCIDLSFNEQHITIVGARKLCMLDAVKRVVSHSASSSNSTLLPFIQTNSRLQEIFGISVLSQKSATKMVKRFKTEITQSRVESKRDREKDIAKKRRQKEEKLDF